MSSPKPPDPDELLAELKAEFTHKKPPAPIKQKSPDELLAELKADFVHEKPPVPQKSPDQLLAELKGSFIHQETPGKKKGNKDNIDDLLADVKKDLGEGKPTPQRTISKATTMLLAEVRESQREASKNNRADEGLNDLLSDIKQEFKSVDLEAELRQKEALVREQRYQEEVKRKRRAALRVKAEQWLKQLDINSSEGLWFEEFSYHYPSKLEAAVDYLEALAEF